MTGSGDGIGAIELLAMEPITDLRFRAEYNMENGRDAIFGGQPLVQALAAAQRTVAGWPAHSLSGNFLRAGKVDRPVYYDVERVRDGRRFAARRVVASQDGKPIHDMLCSFHDPEEGPAHQYIEEPAPPPDSLVNVADFSLAHADRLPAEMVETNSRPFPIELRPVDPERIFFGPKDSPRRDYWFRMTSAAGVADPLDHQCLLAFLSDYWFAGTPAARHFPTGETPRVAVVTLNHSMWFHAPARADGWLLHRTDSPWAGDGRGLARGLIYDEAGRLVATTMQEISIRPR